MAGCDGVVDVLLDRAVLVVPPEPVVVVVLEPEFVVPDELPEDEPLEDEPLDDESAEDPLEEPLDEPLEEPLDDPLDDPDVPVPDEPPELAGVAVNVTEATALVIV